jgi:uncharacterized protein with HEPN domain
MSRHDTNTYLQHMLDHAREAVVMTQDVTRAALDTDRKLSLALVHLLEIVGEAANRIPKEEHPGMPTIPWTQIVGMRNRLAHGSDSVDMDIVWQVVRQDLPSLIAALQAILVGPS